MSKPSSNLNLTALFLDPEECTIETCPIDWAQFRYYPSLAGNAFYLAIFALLLLIQIFLGIRYRIWAFTGSMFGGFVLEILGYVSRVQLAINPFKHSPFLIYIIGLTIGPCFFAAAIYLSFSRIIPIYGENLARFKPRVYTITFICFDVFALVLQAVGGGLADAADSQSLSQTGINIMIAGLAFQVASLTLFILLVVDFAWHIHGDRGAQRVENLGFPEWKLRLFNIALSIATLTIFIRSCFRVAELSGGFNGALANDQVTFMILEGMMVSIACIALTVAHPGLIFGRSWGIAGKGLGFGAGRSAHGAMEEEKGTSSSE